ncbi:conserved Plasmodium protein, unknown function [Plasmodium relictum]|uniref:Tetratricopeptide repeat protein n=1 Tax=Plasmodium relictum TaxID=85471 RepID=A0A1J1H7C0_PLARL|nr:conserved Plasmodium protein, unknown function [Plasmodium relictum]CRG99476.1 conserved Plasmodium protein, unknown function [Plasmodium relictum]
MRKKDIKGTENNIMINDKKKKKKEDILFEFLRENNVKASQLLNSIWIYYFYHNIKTITKKIKDLQNENNNKSVLKKYLLTLSINIDDAFNYFQDILFHIKKAYDEKKYEYILYMSKIIDKQNKYSIDAKSCNENECEQSLKDYTIEYDNYVNSIIDKFYSEENEKNIENKANQTLYNNLEIARICLSNTFKIFGDLFRYKSYFFKENKKKNEIKSCINYYKSLNYYKCSGHLFNQLSLLYINCNPIKCLFFYFLSLIAHNPAPNRDAVVMFMENILNERKKMGKLLEGLKGNKENNNNNNSNNNNSNNNNNNNISNKSGRNIYHIKNKDDNYLSFKDCKNKIKNIYLKEEKLEYIKSHMLIENLEEKFTSKNDYRNSNEKDLAEKELGETIINFYISYFKIIKLLFSKIDMNKFEKKKNKFIYYTNKYLKIQYYNKKEDKLMLKNLILIIFTLLSIVLYVIISQHENKRNKNGFFFYGDININKYIYKNEQIYFSFLLIHEILLSCKYFYLNFYSQYLSVFIYMLYWINNEKNLKNLNLNKLNEEDDREKNSLIKQYHEDYKKKTTYICSNNLKDNKRKKVNIKEGDDLKKADVKKSGEYTDSKFLYNDIIKSIKDLIYSLKIKKDIKMENSLLHYKLKEDFYIYPFLSALRFKKLRIEDEVSENVEFEKKINKNQMSVCDDSNEDDIVVLKKPLFVKSDTINGEIINEKDDSNKKLNCFNDLYEKSIINNNHVYTPDNDFNKVDTENVDKNNSLEYNIFKDNEMFHSNIFDSNEESIQIENYIIATKNINNDEEIEENVRIIRFQSLIQNKDICDHENSFFESLCKIYLKSNIEKNVEKNENIKYEDLNCLNFTKRLYDDYSCVLSTSNDIFENKFAAYNSNNMNLHSLKIVNSDCANKNVENISYTPLHEKTNKNKTNSTLNVSNENIDTTTNNINSNKYTNSSGITNNNNKNEIRDGEVNQNTNRYIFNNKYNDKLNRINENSENHTYDNTQVKNNEIELNNENTDHYINRNVNIKNESINGISKTNDNICNSENIRCFAVNDIKDNIDNRKSTFLYDYNNCDHIKNGKEYGLKTYSDKMHLGFSKNYLYISNNLNANNQKQDDLDAISNISKTKKMYNDSNILSCYDSNINMFNNNDINNNNINKSNNNNNNNDNNNCNINSIDNNNNINNSNNSNNDNNYYDNNYYINNNKDGNTNNIIINTLQNPKDFVNDDIKSFNKNYKIQSSFMLNKWNSFNYDLFEDSENITSSNNCIHNIDNNKDNSNVDERLDKYNELIKKFCKENNFDENPNTDEINIRSQTIENIQNNNNNALINSLKNANTSYNSLRILDISKKSNINSPFNYITKRNTNISNINNEDAISHNNNINTSVQKQKCYLNDLLKKIIILDGKNIGTRYKDNYIKYFDIFRIKFALDYYRDKEYTVKVIMPQEYLTYEKKNFENTKYHGSSYHSDNFKNNNTDNGGNNELRLTKNDLLFFQHLNILGCLIIQPLENYYNFCIEYMQKCNSCFVTNIVFSSSNIKLFENQQTYKNISSHIISYTFLADEFLPNPNFKWPLHSSN